MKLRRIRRRGHRDVYEVRDGDQDRSYPVAIVEHAGFGPGWVGRMLGEAKETWMPSLRYALWYYETKIPQDRVLDKLSGEPPF